MHKFSNVFHQFKIQFSVSWSDSIPIQLGTDHIVYVTSPPTAGILLGFILNVLQNYNFTSANISDATQKIQTYHRITETFKFAYAKRGLLGDPRFESMDEVNY